MRPFNVRNTVYENQMYRRGLFTGNMQVVMMTLNMGEDIPQERHRSDQYIRVEFGTADVTVNNRSYRMHRGDAIMIPGNSDHYIRNAGRSPLKMLVIYSHPEHARHVMQRNQPRAN